MTRAPAEGHDLSLRGRVAVVGCSTKLQSLSKIPFRLLCFPCKSQENREPTSGLEPLTPAPATSLLAYVLARSTTSGNCACLGGFRWSGGIALSTVYQCVSARLQYGLQYMRGRDEVMRQWSIHDPVYRSNTTTCRGLSSSVDALRIEPYGFEVAFYAQCCMPTSENSPSTHSDE
jgi:hypothetical protein